MNASPEITAKAKQWLSDLYDEETRQKVKELIKNNPDELTECFYKNLEFGTGGLRGIMGVGTNRMNKYTVAMATQGLANYIKMMFPKQKQLKVAIAHDSRNNSRMFAEITANVMSANDIKTYLFEDLRPTPELSFAIRELKCQAGVVVTASHNPKEYNGYKAYWEDGGQLVSPHDKNVIAEVNKITDPSMVNFNARPELIETLDSKFDNTYIKNILGLSLSPESIQHNKKLKIVYTPLHGTGGTILPKLFKKAGFSSLSFVDEQMIADGNFPTVVSPNPEEHAALTMAIERAKKIKADIVMATDPDADRVGLAVKDNDGEFVLLNGNQAASILIYYLLTRWKELGKLKGKEYIVKTIVTTELLFDIARKFNVARYDVLTGFKFIANKILNCPDKTFIGGGEESYGYLVSDFVRDKDAMISCFMFAEAAAWAADNGKTLYQLLQDIYVEFGVYREKLVSLTKKGIKGNEEIKAIMNNFRTQPPTSILGSKVIEIRDYLLGVNKELRFGVETLINLPKSDVLQFFTETGDKISVRPSGTEPKIKFYFSIKGKVNSTAGIKEIEENLEKRLNELADYFCNYNAQS